MSYNDLDLETMPPHSGESRHGGLNMELDQA